MLDISNLLNNEYIKQKIAYAENINYKINNRTKFKNISIGYKLHRYLLILNDELFDMEIYLDFDNDLNKYITNIEAKYTVEYLSASPFTLKEYKGISIAEYFNGYYWFDDDYGQEQFRTKENLLSISII